MFVRGCERKGECIFLRIKDLCSLEREREREREREGERGRDLLCPKKILRVGKLIIVYTDDTATSLHNCS